MEDSTYWIGVMVGLAIMRYKRHEILAADDSSDEIMMYLLIIFLWPIVMVACMIFIPACILGSIVYVLGWFLLNDIEDYPKLWAKIRGIF